MMETIIGAIVGAIFAPIGAIIINSVLNGKLISLLGGATSKELEKLKREFTTNPPDSREIHIESGKIKFFHLRGKQVRGQHNNIQINSPDKKFKRISYNGHHFSEPPKIVLSLCTIDSNNIFHDNKFGIPVNTRIRVSTSKDPEENNLPIIGQDSFSIGVEAWDNSYIHEVEVSWIAYGV